MTIHRFFIPVIQFQNNALTLGSDIAWQLAKVLRLKKGDEIVLFEGNGIEYLVTIDHLSPTEVIAVKKKEFQSQSEPLLHIVLYQSILPKRNFEEVLQKATEMGVSEFIPIETNRSILKTGDITDSNLNRWRRIIREAAEQSERGKLPILFPAQTFNEALIKARSEGEVVVPFEDEKKQTIKTLVPIIEKEKSISIFIGPEGGFTAKEIEFAFSKKAHVVSLGTRILRSETASLMLIPILLYMSQDLEHISERSA